MSEPNESTNIKKQNKKKNGLPTIVSHQLTGVYSKPHIANEQLDGTARVNVNLDCELNNMKYRLYSYH